MELRKDCGGDKVRYIHTCMHANIHTHGRWLHGRGKVDEGRIDGWKKAKPCLK